MGVLLAGLSLVSLLTTQNAAVYERFVSVMHVVSEVLNDIMKDDDDDEATVEWTE